MMQCAPSGGNLELVQWLRAEGCPWNTLTCHYVVETGQVEVLRWARENGCPWVYSTKIEAEKLGYTDDLGNLVDWRGNPI